MEKTCVFIVIDSGFSREVMEGSHVLAAWDLTRNRRFESSDELTPAQIADFAGDPMGHGSIVLARLLRLVPDARLILVKAFGGGDACRTRWEHGKIVTPGWTEAYVWAVELAGARGMVSVANCSFGGYVHAMDGTGWEAQQVGRFSGAGKPGHVVVAAAGYGDGRPVHGALTLLPGETKEFLGDQEAECEYNFWFGLGQEPAIKPWTLMAHINSHLAYAASSEQLPANIWNQRQQLKFRIWGAGKVRIDVALANGPRSNGSLKVDVWCPGSMLRKWVSPELIIEPAIFPSVIAVGLRASLYCPNQEAAGSKPDILLPGGDQVSFRLPEVAVAAGLMLQKDPSLDADQIKARLGKFWS